MRLKAIRRPAPVFLVVATLASMAGCGDDDDAPVGQAGSPGSGGSRAGAPAVTGGVTSDGGRAGSSTTGGQNRVGSGGHGDTAGQGGGGAGGEPTSAGQSGGGAGGQSNVECQGGAFEGYSTQSLSSLCSSAEGGEVGLRCDASVEGFAPDPDCYGDWRRTTGCGYVTLSHGTSAYALSLHFDAATEQLVGATVHNDILQGPCEVFHHYGGLIPDACPEATTCSLCTNTDPDAVPDPTVHLCGHEGGAGGSTGEAGAGGSGGTAH